MRLTLRCSNNAEDGYRGKVSLSEKPFEWKNRTAQKPKVQCQQVIPVILLDDRHSAPAGGRLYLAIVTAWQTDCDEDFTPENRAEMAEKQTPVIEGQRRLSPRASAYLYLVM
jgi:hypothetical protein